MYPALIRKTEKKDIRILLQEGRRDLDNLHGHWPLSNKQVAKALEFKGYDHKIVWGDGGHSGRHGGEIFPDSAKWIYADPSPSQKFDPLAPDIPDYPFTADSEQQDGVPEARSQSTFTRAKSSREPSANTTSTCRPSTRPTRRLA